MTYLMTDIVHVIYGFMSSAMRLRTTRISLHETRFQCILHVHHHPHKRDHTTAFVRSMMEYQFEQEIAE